MVLRIDDVNASLAVDGERPGIVQASGGPSRSAPAAERFALLCELLHAMIIVLNHVQLTRRREGEIIWIRQLSRFGPRLAERTHILAVACENLNAMIAGVGGIEQT